MALIPPFFLDAVVSIGMPNQNQTHWIGTGFIVGRPITPTLENQTYHTFLVTNKHVIENKAQITIRFNSLNKDQPLDYVIDLLPNGQPIWIGHQSEEVDIAVLAINPDTLTKAQAEFSFFALDQHVMTIDDMKNEGVSEGDGVFTLGFPMGIIAPQKKHVIVRSGIIARIRDIFDQNEASYLIDANVFPGNSGGPVVLRPEITTIEGTKSINKAALIGIVKSYVPYRDIAVSQQTGNPRVIFEENSGLALVETIDNVKLTVECCYNLKIAGKIQ
ncbi:MAG TPA: hypothetical protein DIC42_01650 [Holosporales bacterium]|nr:hypothetical protein [Holosporales bacterium]